MTVKGELTEEQRAELRQVLDRIQANNDRLDAALKRSQEAVRKLLAMGNLPEKKESEG